MGSGARWRAFAAFRVPESPKPPSALYRPLYLAAALVGFRRSTLCAFHMQHVGSLYMLQLHMFSVVMVTAPLGAFCNLHYTMLVL